MDTPSRTLGVASRRVHDAQQVVRDGAPPAAPPPPRAAAPPPPPACRPARAGDGLRAALLGEQGPLLGLGRVAERELGGEAIQRGLRQRIGAVELHRVLRGDAQERRGQGARLAVHRHLLLGEPLQQRGLRARRGAVDLVGDQHVGEDGAGLEAERAVLGIEEGGADDVRGQQIRRELNPLELSADADAPAPSPASSSPCRARPPAARARPPRRSRAPAPAPRACRGWPSPGCPAAG